MSHITFQNGRRCPVGTIFCIARNYVAHIEELNNERPEQPTIFSKPITALNTDDKIILPHYSADVAYETELVVRLGKTGKNVSITDAASFIDGFAIGLDLTARDIQNQLKSKGLPWELAKGFDGAACVSAFIEADNIAHLENITFSMTLNGKLRQQGNSALMLFPIVEQIAFLSRHFTLRSGDLLYTGTPEGVGTLNSGDRITLTLGTDLISKQFEVIA